jgi:hypothetical protein
MSRFIAVFCLLCLSGCAARGPLYEPAPNPWGNDALVYIYRPAAFAAGGRDAYLYVDDVNIADLSVEGYTWFHIPAGEYALKIPIGVMQRLTLRVRWVRERAYFYRVDTAIRGPYIEWRLTEVPYDVATTQIHKCKLQPAFGVDKLREHALRKCATCT